MKLFTRISVGLALAGGAFVAPAAAHADAPQTIEAVVTFPGVDPCTGEPMLLTLNLQIRSHVHEGVEISTLTPTSGSSDSGYELISGNRTNVINGNTIVDRLIEQWRHPDGRRFRVQIVAVIDAQSGTPRVLRTPPDTVRCVGGPTVI